MHVKMNHSLEYPVFRFKMHGTHIHVTLFRDNHRDIADDSDTVNPVQFNSYPRNWTSVVWLPGIYACAR